MSDPDIQTAGQLICDAIAGLPLSKCYETYAAALGCLVGWEAHSGGLSLSDADDRIDMIAEMAMRHVRANWGEIKEMDGATQ